MDFTLKINVFNNICSVNSKHPKNISYGRAQQGKNIWHKNHPQSNTIKGVQSAYHHNGIKINVYGLTKECFGDGVKEEM